jgi:hypothetical protein
MNATAEFRGMSLEGFVGGVSMFSPADIGEVVWLKRPGGEWEGPFLVVDCSQRTHMYTTLTYVKESVEVDWQTAKRWGMVSGDEGNYQVNEWMVRDVEVWKGLKPPAEESEPTKYDEWFMKLVEFGGYDNNWRWSPDDMAFRNIDEYQIALNKYLREIIDPERVIDLGQKVPDVAKIEIGQFRSMANGREMASPIVTQDDLQPTSVPSVGESSISAAEAHDYTQAYIATVERVSDIFWEVNCQNENPYDGFDMLGTCIPGVISPETWKLPYPKYTIGPATYYAPGIMDQVVRNRGMSLNGYKGAVTLMSCAHIGESVWVRRPGYGWEGPYLVVDCSQPFHMYLNTGLGHLHIEVDYDLWQKWYATSGINNIEVCLGGNDCGGQAVSYSYWWLKNIEWLVPISEN